MNPIWDDLGSRHKSGFSKLFFFLILGVCADLDIGDIIFEFTWIDLLFEPVMRGIEVSRHGEMLMKKSLILTFRRFLPECDVLLRAAWTKRQWLKGHHSQQSCIGVISFAIRNERDHHSQKTCFDTPFSHGAINHQRCTKAEHDGDCIAECKRPPRRLSTKSLLRYFGGIRITNGWSSGRWKCGQTSKENLKVECQQLSKIW